MQYTPPPHVTQHWRLSKPSAKGRRGMVVSQAKGAAEAGVAVLNAGGNAIDAAVATALCLASVEPWNSGLGGIGHALIHRAGQAKADAVDFGPTAPARLDPSKFKLTGKVAATFFLGDRTRLMVDEIGPRPLVVETSGFCRLAVGDAVSLNVRPDGVMSVPGGGRA